MIYMRGQAADYDHWRQLGLTGWGWDDVLPYFKQHENHFLGESDSHGIGGELRIEAPRVHWDLLDAFRTAAEQADIKSVIDFNTGDNEGCCAFHVNQKRGRRWSAATAFLKPVLHRPNLRLETGCLVEGVVFEGRRAVGVRWRQGGKSRMARCRGEVILAAGSIGSAQIMLLSGVGPAQQLAGARHCGGGRPARRRRQPAGSSAVALIYKVDGIATLNERYHAPLGLAGMLAEYVLFRRGPLTMAPSQLGPVHPFRSRSGARQSPVSYSAAVARSLRRAAAQVPRLHRERRQSAADKPRLRTIALARSGRRADRSSRTICRRTQDRRIAVNAIRVTRRIVAQPALAPFHPAEYLPGDRPPR